MRSMEAAYEIDGGAPREIIFGFVVVNRCLDRYKTSPLSDFGVSESENKFYVDEL